MRWSPFMLSFALAGGLTGCGFGEGDARVPGDDLGKFQVAGLLEASTCGVGALGSTELWEFELRLSRSRDELYWLNGREVVTGQIDSDGVSFKVTTRLEVEVLEPEPGYAGCTLERHDRVVGRLSSATTEVERFDAELSYGYGAMAESDCSVLIGVPGGFQSLPCELSYQLSATRSQSPEELRLQR